jgi:hypothetical protein
MKYLEINRVCGVAPDGTRVAKTEPDSGMHTHDGQPRGIPSAKDHSPRYIIIFTVRISWLIILMSCCSTTVVGTPDDKSITPSHREVGMVALTSPSA